MADTIYDRLFDATVRIEAAWPFPVHEPSEALARAFEDQSGRIPAEIESLIARWDDDERDALFSGEGADFNDAFEELAAKGFDQRLFGWIGIAATPIPRFHPDGNGATFSWGHYRTKMIFAPSAESLLEHSVSWAEEHWEAARAKARGEAAS